MSASRTKPISGYATKPQFRRLRPALRNWIAIIDEFVRQHGEPPYFFGSYERVNCGLLAAALWRGGVETLQEFETSRKKETKLGRVDLRLWLSRKTYNAEVKMTWPDLGVFCDTAAIADRMRQKMAVAERGTAKYKIAAGERRLALVFAAPSVPPRVWRKDSAREALIRQFLAAVHDPGFAADFSAYVLPRGFVAWDGCLGTAGGSYYYPGIALLGRLVK